MASAVAVNPELSAAKPAMAPGSGGDERWRPLLALPCQLTVDLPFVDFTVASLLQLGVGSVLRTGWHVTRDVPLRVNDTLIGWSEFEAVANRLAVRLTELA
jgi:flagellar motor switch/type III secretory pathway protein FliN